MYDVVLTDLDLAETGQPDDAPPAHCPWPRVSRNGADYTHCSHCHFSSPTDRNFNLGFRIVFDAYPD
ncbi:MAG: hypothetical protein ACRDTC_03990 [Pseudonocardiaceae bacterium]